MGGGCKMLSLGDQCDCPLCLADKLRYAKERMVKLEVNLEAMKVHLKPLEWICRQCMKVFTFEQSTKTTSLPKCPGCGTYLTTRYIMDLEEARIRIAELEAGQGPQATQLQATQLQAKQVEIERLQSASRNLAVVIFHSGKFDDYTGKQFREMIIACGFKESDLILNKKG